MTSNNCTEKEMRPERGKGLPVSHPIGSKAGKPGAASGSRQLRQPFLTLQVKVAGTAFMGFPWRKMEGWEVEGNEFRQRI